MTVWRRRTATATATHTVPAVVCLPPSLSGSCEEHSGGTLRVAVDGVDGSGKTTFADGLCRGLRAADHSVVRVSLDDFHHREPVRYRRGRTSSEGFWLDSYNYPAFKTHILEPLAPGGTGQIRAKHHDVVSDNLLDHPVQTAPPGSILIVDGMFLHRAELRDEWGFSIFLDVPFGITAARMAERDGTHPNPGHPSEPPLAPNQLVCVRSAGYNRLRGRVLAHSATPPARPASVRPRAFRPTVRASSCWPRSARQPSRPCRAGGTFPSPHRAPRWWRRPRGARHACR